MSDAAVVYLAPTADPNKRRENFPKWRAKGYAVAGLFDSSLEGDAAKAEGLVDWCAAPYQFSGGWPGYPTAANFLLLQSLCAFPNAKAFVIGADDMRPEVRYSATQLLREFGEWVNREPAAQGMGVMQPQGDRYGNTPNICGSPWVTREFAEAACRAGGLFHTGYWHYYADEELHSVLVSRGLIWRRGDLSQYHDHWARNSTARPSFLRPAEAREEADKRLFASRKAAGFPGYDWMPFSPLRAQTLPGVPV